MGRSRRQLSAAEQACETLYAPDVFSQLLTRLSRHSAPTQRAHFAAHLAVNTRICLCFIRIDQKLKGKRRLRCAQGPSLAFRRSLYLACFTEASLAFPHARLLSRLTRLDASAGREACGGCAREADPPHAQLTAYAAPPRGTHPRLVDCRGGGSHPHREYRKASGHMCCPSSTVTGEARWAVLRTAALRCAADDAAGLAPPPAPPRPAAAGARRCTDRRGSPSFRAPRSAANSRCRQLSISASSAAAGPAGSFSRLRRIWPQRRRRAGGGSPARARGCFWPSRPRQPSPGRPAQPKQLPSAALLLLPPVALISSSRLPEPRPSRPCAAAEHRPCAAGRLAA